MNEDISLLISLGIVTIFLFYVTFLVWFRYSTYTAIVNKLSQIQLFRIWPLSKSTQSWTHTEMYKWFARIITLFLLLVCIFLIMVVSDIG